MNNYTGELKGFQVYSTMRDPITLNSVSAEDLIDILERIKTEYRLDELLEFRDRLDVHISDLDNPHNTIISDLPENVLKDMYEVYLERGNNETYTFFKTMVFHVIDIAEQDDLFGDSDHLAMSVSNFILCMRYYHTGPVYAHPIILDELYSGKPTSQVPTLCYRDITDIRTEYSVYLENTIDIHKGCIVLEPYLLFSTNRTELFKLTNSTEEVVFRIYLEPNQIHTLSIEALNKNNTMSTLEVPIGTDTRRFVINISYDKITVDNFYEGERVQQSVNRNQLFYNPNLTGMANLNVNKIATQSIKELDYYANIIKSNEVTYELV